MKVQNTPDGSITDLRPAKTAITVRRSRIRRAYYNIIQKGPIKRLMTTFKIVGGLASRLPIPAWRP